MQYKFIEIKSDINELSNYYKTTVDYSEVFDLLDENTKNDLENLTECIYTNTIKNIGNETQLSFFLDGSQKIDCIDCTFQLYVNEKQIDFKTGKIAPKIGAIISVTNSDYMGNTSDLLQNISISNFNPEDEFDYKNSLFNILFMCYIIITNFKYSPLFYSVYHKDDLKKMVEIRKRNIRLFGKYDECCICYDQTITHTHCNHYLCQKCFLSMKEKKCPMCRECISISESEYSHYE